MHTRASNNKRSMERQDSNVCRAHTDNPSIVRRRYVLLNCQHFILEAAGGTSSTCDKSVR